MSDARATGKRGDLSRRTFLKGAAASAAAVGIASVSRNMALGADASPAPSALPDPLSPQNIGSVFETWAEPEVFTPNGTEQLVQQVVENEGGFRFSYGGKSPGRTIRMRGDETLYARIENKLGRDEGKSATGPGPDPREGYPGPEGAMLATFKGDDQYGDGMNRIPVTLQPDWALGEHLNGVHSAHVTNMHSHGLHVAPGINDNATHSDDIFLRIVPQGDAEAIAANPDLYAKYQEDREEIIGSNADFEFRLGNVMEGIVGPDGQVIRNLPHPPGTHWYHPHSHGATQNQVASGMAGFIIITGDVDDLINERLAGDADAAWDQKSGDWDYRERSVFLQRVIRAPSANISGNSTGSDPDAPKTTKGANKPEPIVNGTIEPGIITMRPGAIERWRVLNGSVDGNGYMRVALLKGEFDDDSASALQKVDYSDGERNEFPVSATDFAPISYEQDGSTVLVEKADIWQLAWDGVTRVVVNDDGSASYRLRDLSTINDGVEPNLADFFDCYKPGNLESCYNRPNELYMVDGNRADLMFQAPALEGADQAVYTLVALPAVVGGMRESTSKVLAHVVVSGEPVPGAADYAFDELLDDLAVSPYELPIGEDELEISTPAERAARDVGDGTAYRTRVLRYGGWGAAALPIVEANDEYIAANPDKERLSYYTPPPTDSTNFTLPVSSDDQTGVPVTNLRRYPDGDLPAIILPPATRTMNIDGQKFFPTDENAPAMLLNTAEEWAVYNHSLETYSVPLPDGSWTPEQVQEYVAKNPEMLYYQFDYVDEQPDGAPDSPQPYYGIHRTSYPMWRGEANAVNAKRSTDGDPWTQRGQMVISTSAVDHPFHIHQNPVWVTRMDVPDENGDMVNVLSEPRWADVVDLPRNGGRVVFRSRFMDFEGEYVDHCHILLHEDNGMMQRIMVLGDPASSNYEPRAAVASGDAAAADVDAIYGKPSPVDSWKRSMSFVDGNATGQVFPGEGFDTTPPEPPTE